METQKYIVSANRIKSLILPPSQSAVASLSLVPLTYSKVTLG